MGLQMRTVCPWLQSPGLPHIPDADITWRWQMKVQMSWFTASPRTFLLAGPLRLALAQHLGLRIYAPGQRCRYIPLTTGRVCGKQLGTHSAHACTCAQGPSLRRHNRLRDEWIKLCRQAGWHTDPEQIIRTREDDTKRADLVALTPEGARLAADVMVRGTHTGIILLAAKTQRHPAIMRMPGPAHQRAQLLSPLVHDALNHWLSQSALRLLYRLTVAGARRSAPEAPKSWGHHFHHVSMSLATSLLHISCVSAWHLHAACGDLL